MDIAEFKRRVQNRFGDEFNDQISDQDLIDFLNEAQRTVVRETQCIYVSATSAANIFPITIADLMLLDRVTYDTRYLEFTSEDKIDNWHYMPQSGVPVGYYLKGNKVYLWPTPLASDTKSVVVSYVPQPTQYTTGTSTSTALAVPIPFHDDLVTFGVARAYEFAQNYRAFELAMAEFNKNLGMRSFEVQVGKDEAPQVGADPYDYDLDGSLL